MLKKSFQLGEPENHVGKLMEKHAKTSVPLLFYPPVAMEIGKDKHFVDVKMYTIVLGLQSEKFPASFFFPQLICMKFVTFIWIYLKKN